jgi:hypothetical protein
MATGSSTPLPDCETGNITISEIYPDDNGWLELHNSGSGDCDLGGWQVFDENSLGNQNDGLLLDNGTNISSDEYLQFNYSSDFGFYIGSSSDEIYLATRGVSMENATLAVEWDSTSRDGHSYSTSRDGSYELCEGEYDWNEPDELTPGSQNLCEGDPIVLYAQEDDGSWTEDPDSVSNSNSQMLWDTSNLDNGTQYYFHYSWNTAITSGSESFYFTADGTDIAWDIESEEAWSCFLHVHASIRNESSGQTIEYYDRELDIDCSIDSELILYDTYFSSSSFSWMGIEVDEDYLFDSGSTRFRWRAENLAEGYEYDLVGILYQDGEVTNIVHTEWHQDTGSSSSASIDETTDIGENVCDLAFTGFLHILSPHGWIEITKIDYDLDGPCDGSSGSVDPLLNLYAIMDNETSGGQSWEMVDSTNDDLNVSADSLQEFYWDLPVALNASYLRFYFYFDGDKVMDEHFVYDSQPIYWNATIPSTECSPYIYGYLYLNLPTDGDVFIDNWHEWMDVDCDDPGDMSLYVHNESNSQYDLINGTNDMVWNLSDLDAGTEYAFEWYSHRSSSHTATEDGTIHGEYHNSTTFTATAEYSVIDWELEAPGDWCDVDIYGYLYTKTDFTQEWWDDDDDYEEWYQVDTYSRDLDPVCDGSDVVPFNPVSLSHKDNGNWVEVNDTTNLSVGTHQMKWQVSGIQGDDLSLRLSTRYEYRLNSSWEHDNWYSDGDFEVEWDLVITDWSCSIDIEFDLYYYRSFRESSTHHMDNEYGDPKIGGPCNDPIDISRDEGLYPEISMSVMDGDSMDDLDDVYEITEGTTTFRWEVSDAVQGYEHSINAYLSYNGSTQEVLHHDWIADSDDEWGNWSIDLQGDVCGLSVHAQLYVRESDGWYHANTVSRSFSYTGSSYCDYSSSEIVMSIAHEEIVFDNSSTIAAGQSHTCAILDDGSVACWGRNTYGQLGDGTTTAKDTPTPTASLGDNRTAVAIAAGEQHTCAILDDGSVACWGANDQGALGDGTTTDRHTPTPTTSPGANRAAGAISAGDYHTCAILDDGSDRKSVV